MASCEKCWELAGGDVDKYHQLLNDNDCSPEEQAGSAAESCPSCGRKTVHQYARVCVNSACLAYREGKEKG